MRLKQGTAGKQQEDTVSIKATALATEIAQQHGIKRHAAFDMIIAVSLELGLPTQAYTLREAGEIERLIAEGIAAGNAPVLNRPSI